MKPINSLFALLLCLSIMFGCSKQQSLPKAQHDITKITPKNIDLIWSKDNVYTVWSTFDTTIGASNNRICFLGGLDPSEDSNIICLNGSDGNLLWQAASGNHSAIAVIPDGALVIYRNIVGIRRYQSSGNIVWDKQLSGTGSNYLYIVDDQIQVLTVPEKFWILDFNGNELDMIPGDKIFIRTPEETFIESNGIQLRNTDSNKVIWQYQQFDDVLEMAPVFIPGFVFVRTGQESGSIYTFNRTTGQLLWKTESNIISNIVYSPFKKTIYALTYDGFLLSIEVGNGKENKIAQFSAVPFVLNGEAEVGSYQLAYDLDKHILFASLGDSRQLFAFQEK